MPLFFLYLQGIKNMRADISEELSGAMQTFSNDIKSLVSSLPLPGPSTAFSTPANPEPKHQVPTTDPAIPPALVPTHNKHFILSLKHITCRGLRNVEAFGGENDPFVTLDLGTFR